MEKGNRIFESLDKILVMNHREKETQAPGGSQSNLGETFSNLIDVMDIAMWELDMAYRVVGYNKKAAEIYGKDVLETYCYHAAAGLDFICENCPAKQVYDGQESGRSQHERTDVSGRKIYIDHIATPIKNRAGTLTGVLVLIIDITKQKELEKEIVRHHDELEEKVLQRTEELESSHEKYRSLYDKLKKSETLYRSLINSSPDAIVIYDMDGRVQYLNPSFTETFGWSLAELKGKRIPFVPESEIPATRAQIRRIVQTGKPTHNFQTRRMTQNGRIIDIYISASKYEDPENDTMGILAILKDITHSKNMEMQLQRAQRMEALGTLAGGIAHDFNNLLMGIQGNASLMQYDLSNPGDHKEKLEKIEKYVRMGVDLTKQLLGLARGGKYEIKTINMNALIDGSAKMFGRTKKEITIHRSYQADLWSVEVDKGQIEQVLLNLFVNAWQAMPTGGELTLSTKNFILHEASAGSYNIKPGKYVKISITDTGTGIDKSIQDRIFDPFFTTKEKERGTGLGLASVYGIVSNHNGMINLASEAGKGTTFYLYLPASAKPLPTEKAGADQPVTGNATILLIDDEEMVIDVGGQLLEHLGHEVLIARSGDEAIEIYQNKSDQIDMVILDMIMPGKSGKETFGAIQSINPDVKVLLSSGYSINGQAAEIMAQGCCGFIQKPFGINKLSRKIRDIIES